MGDSCSNCCGVCKFGGILILIGGINWGLVGLGGFLGSDLNVVSMILGSMPKLEWLVYVLVGLATISKALKCCKCCK